MNANLVVCIPVIPHVLIASTRKEATAVSANVATKVMDGHAYYLVIIIFLLMMEYSVIELLRFYSFIDNSICNTLCDHHCIHQGTDSRCVCDRGYYLASDEITCIGNEPLHTCITHARVYIAWLALTLYA